MDYPYVKYKLQHRSALFFLDEEQEHLARKVVQWIIDEKAEGQPVYTDVEKATKFYCAEEYHQNFIAKRRELRTLKKI
jgi:peptide-methionine (S)-S-oxide reductase